MQNSMNRISIVNFGSGNIGSIRNMIKRSGNQVEIIESAEEVYRASHLVLPGVGSYDNVVSKLSHVKNLVNALNYKVLEESTPILGICVGMQVMLTSSEEGHLSGLNWVPGVLTKFPDVAKVPHIGWNKTTSNRDIIITQSIKEARFYFVHSYFASLENSSQVLFNSNYAGVQFVSGIIRDNIIGVQFHPERSHRYGLQLFQNFARM